MRDGTRRIIFLLLCIGFAAYLLISSLSDLTNQADLHTVHIDGCTEILTVKKTLSFIIPTGTDHYYLAADYEKDTVCLIKAPESWYKKNFNAEHEAYQTGGITVTALAKRASRSNTRMELERRVNDLEAYGKVNYSVDPQRVLVLEYKKLAIEKLASFILGLAFAVLVYIAIKQDPISKSVAILLRVIGLAFVVMLFVVLLSR